MKNISIALGTAVPPLLSIRFIHMHLLYVPCRYSSTHAVDTILTAHLRHGMSHVLLE